MKRLRINEILLGLLVFIVSQGIYEGQNVFCVAAFVAAVAVGENVRIMGAIAIISNFVGWYIYEDMRFVDIIPTIMSISVMIFLLSGRIYTKLPEKNKETICLVCCFVTTISSNIAIRGLNIKSILIPVVITGVALIFIKGFKRIHYGFFSDITNEELASLITIFMITIISLPKIENDYFSLEMTLVFFIVLMVSYMFGSSGGALCGALSGIVLCRDDYDFFVYVTILVFAGLIAGLFVHAGKIMSAGAFLIFITLCYLYDYFGEVRYIAMDVYFLAAAVGATVLFILLPFKGLKKMSEVEKRILAEFDENNVRKYTKMQLMGMSEEFMRLSTKLSSKDMVRITENSKDLEVVMDNTTTMICGECHKRDECWSYDYNNTANAMGIIFDSVCQHKEIRTDALPKEFTRRCDIWENIAFATSQGVENLKQKIHWENQLTDIRDGVGRQMKEIALLINDYATNIMEPVKISYFQRNKIVRGMLSEGVFISGLSILKKKDGKMIVTINAKLSKKKKISLVKVAKHLSVLVGKELMPSAGKSEYLTNHLQTYDFVENTIYKVLSGVARIASSKEGVNGDSYSLFKTLDKSEVMIIADGMGRGKNAYNASSEVVDLLERFIEAGFQIPGAMNLINAMMIFENKSENSSTIDVCWINRYTGICNFIKVGASYSFIKRKKWVESIVANTFPAGIINETDCDNIVKKLYDGDYVIMISDGVLDCFSEENINLLENFISELKISGPNEMAEKILEYALSQVNGYVSDDMTVLVAGVWQKNGF